MSKHRSRRYRRSLNKRPLSEKTSPSLDKTPNIAPQEEKGLSNIVKKDLVFTFQLTFILFLLAIFFYYVILKEVSLNSLMKIFNF